MLLQVSRNTSLAHCQLFAAAQLKNVLVVTATLLRPFLLIGGSATGPATVLCADGGFQGRGWYRNSPTWLAGGVAVDPPHPKLGVLEDVELALGQSGGGDQPADRQGVRHGRAVEGGDALHHAGGVEGKAVQGVLRAGQLGGRQEQGGVCRMGRMEGTSVGGTGEGGVFLVIVVGQQVCETSCVAC
jgi:hypothetical protein